MSDLLTKGDCLCGAVSFEITGQPVRMAQCHCRDCRRASGTGHMSLAFFKQEDVSIQGQTRAFTSVADSGNQVTREFCATCGSRLFARNTGRPGIVNVAVGCVEDSSWFTPQAVVFAKDQPAWDHSSEDAPRFDTMPPPAG